jgi:parallel beta-helix repeat protein
MKNIFKLFSVVFLFGVFVLAPQIVSAAPGPAPTIVSANFTGPNQLTIVFSEPVTGATTDFSILNVQEMAIITHRQVTDLAGDSTNTLVLTFDGNALNTPTSDFGTIDINNTEGAKSVKSVSGGVDLVGGTYSIGNLSTIYVYSPCINAPGLYCGVNGFSTIQEGINAVTTGGTVRVAAGTYVENVVIDKTLTLIGAGADTTTIDADGEADFAIELEANGIEVSGFTLTGTSGNVPSAGIAIYQVDGCNIHDNIFTGNRYGMWLSSAEDNIITNNDASHNNQVGFFLAWSNNNTFTGNTADSTGIGFRIQASSGSNTFTGNTATNNIRGFHILASSSNVITGNTITDNSQYGMRVENNSIGNDLTENWWGDASGPYEENYNSNGEGQTLSFSNSNYNYFRPWCIDSLCHGLSSIEVTPDTLSTLFDNGGSIVPVLDLGAPQNETTVSVTSLNVNEDTTIKVPIGDINNAVNLPKGTIITKTDTENPTFNASDITASSVALDSLSGFAPGVVLKGAFQWGIPELGLTFTPGINVYIYVGTDLAGRTLSVLHSSSMDSGWNTNGIANPTCIVSEDGFCSFVTTRASYFATTAPEARHTSSGSSVGAGHGPVIVPITNTTPTAPVVSEISKVTQDLKLGIANADVKTLQLFLISQNKGLAALALSTHGATDYFGKLTKAALAEWQKVNGIIPATGYFGPKTRAKIKELGL